MGADSAANPGEANRARQTIAVGVKPVDMSFNSALFAERLQPDSLGLSQRLAFAVANRLLDDGFQLTPDVFDDFALLLS